MRAGLYLRVSTTDQEDNTSLLTQEQAGRKHAKSRSYDLLEEHIYREIHTGVELWERRELTRLREAIRRHELDVLIVYAIDRLARDPVHLGVILTEAEHHGVTVEFVTEPLDNSPEGQLIRFVRGYAAKVEHEKIKERTWRGKQARLDSGRQLPGCRAPFGYHWQDESKNFLQPDPETAPVVVKLFEDAVSGKTLRQIALWITATGITPPSGRGHPRWSHQSVKSILGNRIYTGEASSLRGKVRIPNASVPLITPAVFEAVQKRLSDNKVNAYRNNRDPEATLLRAGHIFCGHCGDAMIVQNKRPSREEGARYRCARGVKYDGLCTAHGISAKIIDPLVWQRVEETLLNPETVARELNHSQGEDPVFADLKAVDKRLSQIERQQNNLIEQLSLVPSSVAAMLRSKLENLDTHKHQLLGERQSILARKRLVEQAREQLQSLEAWRENVAEQIKRLTYQDKRTALEALQIRVLVYRVGHDPRFDIQWGLPVVSTTTSGTRHNVLTLRWTDRDFEPRPRA